MGDDRQHEHQRHRDEQPVEHEAQERQLEHVEPDVDAELGVGPAERAAVAEQHPLLPLGRRRQGHDDRQEDGTGVAHEPQSVPEHLVEALHDRMDVGGEALGRQPVGDEQVDAGQQQERGEEDQEQRALGPDDAPEHVGAPQAVVPEVVDVEPGDGPSEHDKDEDEDAERDEDGPTGDATPTCSPPREVGGTAHGR